MFFVILVSFLSKTCNPIPEKVIPPFPATPSKSWGPFKPPFLEIRWEVHPPSRKAGGRGGGAHYGSNVHFKISKNFEFDKLQLFNNIVCWAILIFDNIMKVLFPITFIHCDVRKVIAGFLFLNLFIPKDALLAQSNYKSWQTSPNIKHVFIVQNLFKKFLP